MWHLNSKFLCIQMKIVTNSGKQAHPGSAHYKDENRIIGENQHYTCVPKASYQSNVQKCTLQFADTFEKSEISNVPVGC